MRYVQMSKLTPGKLFVTERNKRKVLGFSLVGTQSHSSVLFEQDPRLARRLLNVLNSFVLELEYEWSLDIAEVGQATSHAHLNHNEVPIVLDAKAAYMPVEVDHTGHGQWQSDWLIVSGVNRFELAAGETMPTLHESCAFQNFSISIRIDGNDKIIDPFDVYSI